MEKVCEFCTDLRPLVYCKADAAYLCLSCDAKVHLANALFGRHLRTLVCNSCRYRLAYVQCLDHKMLICHDCDQKLHDVSLTHRKRAVRSFMGCPSPKDFATLWGFGLNEIENCVSQDHFASISCVSAVSNGEKASGQAGNSTRHPSMASEATLHGGSSNRQGQILYSDQERQTILKQIVDLKRVQLNEESDQSIKIKGPRETDLSSSVYQTIRKLDEKLNQQEQNSQALLTNTVEKDSPTVNLNPETLPSAFSQLDNLSSSIIDLPLQGELFWTCRSPLRSNQLWSQNIQDLGICEEHVCHDDFNIPDVDLTFQNFEELFGGDQDPVRALLADEDVSCSSLEKDMSIDKSDIDNLSTMEDSSAAVSITISHSAHEKKDVNTINNLYCLRNMDPTHTIQPFESTTSLSVSRLSAQSSRMDHDDSILSPCSEGKGYSGSSAKLEISHVEARGSDVVTYKEKKSKRHEKQIRLPSRKPGAHVRKRVKGIAKAESY